MTDCLLVNTWATMDAYELSSIGPHTLLGGIQQAAEEIERLRADLQHEIAKVMELRQQLDNPTAPWNNA